MELRLSEREQRSLRLAFQILLSQNSSTTEAEWHAEVMSALLPLTRANTGAIRTTDRGSVEITPVGFDPAVIGEYVDYYQQFDYGRALGGSQARGQLFSRNMFYGDNLPAFRKSEFYADYLSRNNFLDAMCLSTRTDLHDRGSVAYFWYDKDMSASNRERVVALLHLIAPAFHNGMASRSAQHKRHQDLLSSVDRYEEGCALFTHEGTLLHRNPALSRLFGISEDRDGLLAQIQHQVQEARRLVFTHEPLGVFLPKVSTDFHSGASTFRISTCVLDAAQTGTSPSILVTVTQMAPRLLDVATCARVCNRFGLTRREGEVAMLLHHRLTNREIAAELGVSEHTARHHTERIISKLQVAGRTDVRKKISEETTNCTRP